MQLAVFMAAMMAACVLSKATDESSTETPLVLPVPPKLDRAHKSKLLLEIACQPHCKYVTWQIKRPHEESWRRAEARVHLSYPDSFYIFNLLPSTIYQLRALLAAAPGETPYSGDDVPVLQVQTCPNVPPPVSSLFLYSAGPGWLDIRFKPPPKEECKSHLFYQVRYRSPGTLGTEWKEYGFYRVDQWVYFRPTHPCSSYPDYFCVLLTDNVKAGHLHVVEVRVCRFDETSGAYSSIQSIAAKADMECLISKTCKPIGGENWSPSVIQPGPKLTTVEKEDTDLLGQEVETTTPLVFANMTFSPQTVHSKQSNSFKNLAPFFLTLFLLSLVAIPIVYFVGRRHGARAVEQGERLFSWRKESSEAISSSS